MTQIRKKLFPGYLRFEDWTPLRFSFHRTTKLNSELLFIVIGLWLYACIRLALLVFICPLLAETRCIPFEAKSLPKCLSFFFGGSCFVSAFAWSFYLCCTPFIGVPPECNESKNVLSHPTNFCLTALWWDTFPKRVTRTNPGVIGEGRLITSGWLFLPRVTRRTLKIFYVVVFGWLVWLY